VNSPRNPRSIITPESFTVAPQLLGLPLARPVRRATAFLLDLLPLGILANVGLGTFLAFLAAFLAWRALAFISRDRPAKWKTFVRAATSAIALIAVLRVADSFDGDNEDRSTREGLTPDSIAALVLNAQQTALGRVGVPLETRDSVSASAADSAIVHYAAALQRADSQAMDSLRPFAAHAVAGERLRQLEQGSRALAEEMAETEQEKDELQEQLRQRQGRLTAWISAAAENLGIGFGWGALYFTTFLAMGKGQTPGKRLMGIRVIRLDAKPVTWLMAFERFGGYFASASTGLLGFLQIFWDRNRQALHDKVAETVVIRVLPGSSIPNLSSTPAPHAHR
jgi:hypothetical protein